MNPMKRLHIPSRLLIVVFSLFALVVLLMASTAQASPTNPGGGVPLNSFCVKNSPPSPSYVPNVWIPTNVSQGKCKPGWTLFTAPPGPQGPQGPQGPSGLSVGWTVVNHTGNVSINNGPLVYTQVVGFQHTLPAGNYIVTASVPMYIDYGDSVTCQIELNSQIGNAVAQGSSDYLGDAMDQTLTLTDTLTLSFPDYIMVGCYDQLGSGSFTSTYAGASITALQLDTIYTSIYSTGKSGSVHPHKKHR